MKHLAAIHTVYSVSIIMQTRYILHNEWVWSETRLVPALPDAVSSIWTLIWTPFPALTSALNSAACLELDIRKGILKKKTWTILHVLTNCISRRRSPSSLSLPDLSDGSRVCRCCQIQVTEPVLKAVVLKMQLVLPTWHPWKAWRWVLFVVQSDGSITASVFVWNNR